MTEVLDNKQKGLITDFKAKAREFWALWRRLDSRRNEVSDLSPEMQSEYADLIERGQGIRSKIEWVTNAIDQAAGAYDGVKQWLTDTFGLGELSYRQIAGLGVIPLIPIAVISAAVAAIGYWINDAYQFNAKLDEIRRLENRGIPSDQAADIVERTLSKKGLFAGAGNLILPLALGAGILFMLRKR